MNCNSHDGPYKHRYTTEKGYYRFAGKENVFRFCPQQDGILSITSLNYQQHGSKYHVGFALHSGMYMDYEEGTPEKDRKRKEKK